MADGKDKCFPVADEKENIKRLPEMQKTGDQKTPTSRPHTPEIQAINGR